MIKKILNYTMFLICMMSILTYDVNAMTVQNDLGITLPPSSKLFNNVGGTLAQKDYFLQAGTNDTQSDAWLYNSNDMSLIGRGNGVVISSLANGLLPGHEYFLTMYFALSNNYNISYGYEPESTRYFGVTSSLYQVPKNNIVPTHNGYFPTSQYVTNSSSASYPYLASFYVRFKIPSNIVGSLGFYISLSSSTTINFGYANIAYLGYDLVDTTTLTTSQQDTLTAIYENTQNLSTAEVREAIEDLNATQNITNDKIDETNSELNDLNDNITNNNVSGVEESFSNFDDFLDNNSTITKLITLPVTLYSSILQGVSNSCSPFNLGSLYGENLILPCVDIGSFLGSTLWGMIDLIISGFAVYSISKKLIKVFNNFSSMKDGDVIDD